LEEGLVDLAAWLQDQILSDRIGEAALATWAIDASWKKH
jgi:hypothetical protein